LNQLTQIRVQGSKLVKTPQRQPRQQRAQRKNKPRSPT
jgi:hypothetical protein